MAQGKSVYGKWSGILARPGPINLEDTEDPKAAEYARILSNVQGNILQSHRRQYSIQLLLAFDPKKCKEARRFIQDLAREYVTTAMRQYEESKRRREEGIDGTIFGSIHLSYSGYKALCIPKSRVPYDPRFRRGMKTCGPGLHDPPWNSKHWEPGYKKEVHAMVLLADNDKSFLTREVARVRRALGDVGEVVASEEGEVQRDKTGRRTEHFGFVDGVSQPLFITPPTDVKTKSKKGTRKRRAAPVYDPASPLGVVLVRDPLGGGSESFGSFAVFRKLEQDYKMFHTQVLGPLGKGPDSSLADSLLNEAENHKEPGRRAKDPSRKQEFREKAAALVVGRFRNGHPLVKSDDRFDGERLKEKEVDNNFVYSGDGDGSRCPLHAHIRRHNPRVKLSRNRVDVPRWIVRRAIPYGSLHKEHPEEKRGLLFLCYQSSIAEQFEHIQKRANSPSDGGIDPLIGQWKGRWDKKKPHPPAQKWPREYDDARAGKISFPVGGFVTLRGGEYFFAPSVSFLQNLGDLTLYEQW